MALMKISEYLLSFTPASRPDRRTVVAWIERGELYGEKRGRDWYVDPQREIAPQRAPQTAPGGRPLGALAQKILNEG